MRAVVSIPAISVVMPLYNKERDVARAIRSVLAQSFADYELIVVDDGSTDRSVEKVAAFNDPRIRLVHQENQGVSAARNRGIAEARAELVAFLDADDEWLPKFLSFVLALREEFPSSGIWATSYRIAQPDNTVRTARLNGVAGSWKGIFTDYFEVAALSDPPIHSSAVLVKRNLLNDIGGFPQGISSGEDLLVWSKLACRAQVAYDARPLTTFYAPATMKDRPGRVPQTPDQVGEGIARLADQFPHRAASIRNYLARWHEMRGTLFLELGARANARQEYAKSMVLSKLSPRTALLFVASCLPLVIGRNLLHIFRRIRVLCQKRRFSSVSDGSRQDLI